MLYNVLWGKGGWKNICAWYNVRRYGKVGMFHQLPYAYWQVLGSRCQEEMWTVLGIAERRSRAVEQKTTMHTMVIYLQEIKWVIWLKLAAVEKFIDNNHGFNIVMATPSFTETRLLSTPCMGPPHHLPYINSSMSKAAFINRCLYSFV